MKLDNVLSLCDGSGIGRVALRKAKIGCKHYYASEIDASAIAVAQHNNPDIIQLGDIKNLTAKNLPVVDMLFSGSPCQDLSRGNTNSPEGLCGEKSKIFWQVIRVFMIVNPKWFLFESVPMDTFWADIISRILGIKPIKINSNLVSAQNRERWYWTNIPHITQPKDLGILVKHIIDDNSYKTYHHKNIKKTKRITRNKSCVVWDTSGKNYFSQHARAYFLDGKLGTLTAGSASQIKIVLDYENDIYRLIQPIEAERAQTYPDNYTNVPGITNQQRFKMLGNGWTVDVITHILSFLPKKKISGI